MKQEFYIILHHSCGEVFPFETAYPIRLIAEDFVLDELRTEIMENYSYNEDELEAIIESERKSLQEENYASFSIGENQTIYEIHKIHLLNEQDIPMTDEEREQHYQDTIKKQKKTKNKVNGLYPKKFIEGFFDPYIEDDAAHRVLSAMGLPDNILPFDVEEMLNKGVVTWKDSHNNIAGISFAIQDNLLICSASYLGKTASNNMDLNDYEDETSAAKAKLISQDIGAGCVEAIDEVFDYDTYPYPYLDGDE